MGREEEEKDGSSQGEQGGNGSDKGECREPDTGTALGECLRSRTQIVQITKAGKASFSSKHLSKTVLEIASIFTILKNIDEK